LIKCNITVEIGKEVMQITGKAVYIDLRAIVLKWLKSGLVKVSFGDKN